MGPLNEPRTDPADASELSPLPSLPPLPENPAPVVPASPDRSGPLALLEAIDRDGLVRQAWRVDRWPLTIGRALDNDVVLSDLHVAPHHARLTRGPDDAGSLQVTAGDTRNGLGVGRERVEGGAERTFADTGHDLELTIGRHHLRLRLPGHALAAEQLMAPLVGRELRWLSTLGLAVVVLAGVLFGTWLEADPDTLGRAAGAALLSTLLVGMLWCGLWALLSKIFARQGFFGWHVRVALLTATGLLTLSVVPALLAFAFSWPWLTDFSFVAVYATAAAGLYFHLLAVEPARAHMMRVVAVSGFVVGVALTMWLNVQRTGRLGEELYMSHLFPPSLRLARPIAVEPLVDSLTPMQAILDRQAKERSGADGGDPLPADDDEERNDGK